MNFYNIIIRIHTEGGYTILYLNNQGQIPLTINRLFFHRTDYISSSYEFNSLYFEVRFEFFCNKININDYTTVERSNVVI